MRKKVKRFAMIMERKLRENSFKGGWAKEDWRWLLGRLNEEMLEFQEALFTGKKVSSEAADIANFLMMICDVRGELKTYLGGGK